MFDKILTEVKEECKNHKISEREIIREAERRWARVELVIASMTPQYIDWLFSDSTDTYKPL